MDWRNRAACLDEDPELFFPIGNTGPALLQIEEAKQVCRRCDVRDACLQWALEAGQDHGVWGGLSEDERRALKRRAARARIRTAWRCPSGQVGAPRKFPALLVLSHGQEESLAFSLRPTARFATVSSLGVRTHANKVS